MSLLSQASLCVTPNAYKEGKLYSVIPSDGSGDMSVTRATTATRVNSAGLVELVPYNLFTYSSSFSNAAWANLNATLTGGQSGYDGTTNAFLITDNSTNGLHIIQQTPIVSGQHTISVYAKANTLNWLWLRGVQSSANVRAWFNLSTGTVGTVDANGTANIVNVGNGWYRCELTIANHESGFEFYVGVSNANNVTSYVGSGQSLYIQDAQLNEGTILPYQKTETRLNIPRLDYSNGTCPSLLVEPQRTNLVLQSSSFDSASWILDGNGVGQSVTANYSISPDGTQNAYRLQLNKTGGIYSRIFQNVSSGTNAYSFTVYMKSNTSASQNVGLRLDTTGINCVVTTSWQRFELNATVGTQQAQILLFDSISGNDEIADISIWGAQLEVGSYPTSYIPTTSASVTRNADQISKTGISSLIGQTEGVIFVQIKKMVNGYNYFSISDGTTNNWIFVGQDADSPNKIRGYVKAGGVVYADIFSGVIANGTVKMAIAYKANDVVLYVNGSLIGSDTSVTIPSSLTDVSLNSLPSVSASIIFSVDEFALFKTRLTNAQLASLTSI